MGYLISPTPGKTNMEPAAVILPILHGTCACKSYWGKYEMANQAVACKHRTPPAIS